jgi:hypothetical protein
MLGSVFSSILCLRLSRLALALVVPSVVALYRLFFHPLAGVPGPRFAAVSTIWYAWNVRQGRLLSLGKTLHQKYGPAVRVGPNEVWFDSPEAYKAIYSEPDTRRWGWDGWMLIFSGAGSGFHKSDFYSESDRSSAELQPI